MNCTDRYAMIPADIRNNRTVKSYKHIPISNDILSRGYCHFVREETKQDIPVTAPDGPQYFGDWKDVTELDQAEERVKRAKKELIQEALKEKRAAQKALLEAKEREEEEV